MNRMMIGFISALCLLVFGSALILFGSSADATTKLTIGARSHNSVHALLASDVTRPVIIKAIFSISGTNRSPSTTFGIDVGGSQICQTTKGWQDNQAIFELSCNVLLKPGHVSIRAYEITNKWATGNRMDVVVIDASTQASMASSIQ
ncbi:MAG: hypothetical protein V4517_09100 [Pseudomonadota bacterium]